MWTFSSRLLLCVLLAWSSAVAADGILGQFQDGINGKFSEGINAPFNGTPVPPPPPPFLIPTVNVTACNITVPVSSGSNVALFGGGFCSYTATCSGLACTGGNAITSWAITAQSCTDCFAITNTGALQGGTAAASVAAGNTYTVTVTATNATGTSPAVTQNIAIPVAPAVVAASCSITTPVTPGAAVALSGGGNCVFTATCATVACTGVNAITSWAVITQSCTNCFAVDNGGNVLGGVTAGTVTPGSSYTVTVTAANFAGTSPQQVQAINSVIVGPAAGLLLENGLDNLLAENAIDRLCLESGC